MIRSGIPIKFHLHCVSKGTEKVPTSHMDIKKYLDFFNDRDSNTDITYSSDIAIIVKKEIGKHDKI